MNLQLDTEKIIQYKSNTQKIRVITEDWVMRNMFCPYCGHKSLLKFVNNKPVADFFCPSCKEEYELKSNSKKNNNIIPDGAYKTMIERIISVNNPNFFFMNYNKKNLSVENFIMLPKFFISIDMIEKRKPLAATARRAGWTGCNILLNRIPNEGLISIIADEKELPKAQIFDKLQKIKFLQGRNLEARGWILDILTLINDFKEKDFSLSKMYGFEEELALKYPNNHHIRAKIRQQLQILRDNGVIEFLGKGNYRKI